MEEERLGGMKDGCSSGMLSVIVSCREERRGVLRWGTFWVWWVMIERLICAILEGKSVEMRGKSWKNGRKFFTVKGGLVISEDQLVTASPHWATSCDEMSPPGQLLEHNDIQGISSLLRWANDALKETEQSFDNDSFDAFVKKAQTDAKFRYTSFSRDLTARSQCALSGDVWNAILSLSPREWNLNTIIPPLKVQILASILRFAQFFFAGQPRDSLETNGQTFHLYLPFKSNWPGRSNVIEPFLILFPILHNYIGSDDTAQCRLICLRVFANFVSAAKKSDFPSFWTRLTCPEGVVAQYIAIMHG